MTKRHAHLERAGACAARRRATLVVKRALDLAPLAGGVKAVWRGYDSVVPRWVRKAERAGLEVTLHADASGIDGFMPVYLHTMDRCDAQNVFPRSFFEALTHHLAGQYVFAHVLLEGKVDAQAYAELALRRADVARHGGGAWVPQPGFFPAYRAPPAMDGS